MRTLLTLVISALLCAARTAAAAQQIVGEFPLMDGGFEDQAAGPPAVVSSFVGEQTQWTAQNVALGATNNASGGRSGPQYMELNHAGAVHYRLQSPSTTGILTGMPYVIQFYYMTVSSYIQGAIRAAVSPSGTTAVGFYTPYFHTNNVANWTKFTNTYYTSTSYGSGNGIGVISVNSNVQFLIDDYVIYAGTDADTTAPNPPTTFASNTITATSIGVAWTAPGTGVDGGGYLVVRGTADPATSPNVNGIYAVGNALNVTGTIVYIGTDTTFTDSNLTMTTEYRYRIYTVDKAFNYSTALLGTARTIPEPFSAAALASLAGLGLALLRRP